MQASSSFRAHVPLSQTLIKWLSPSCSTSLKYVLVVVNCLKRRNKIPPELLFCPRARSTRMWVCWGFVLHSILLFLCAVYTQHIPRTGGLKIYLTEFPPVGLCAQRCITGNFAARLSQGDVPLDTNWLKMFENSADSSCLTRYKLQLGYCSSEVIIRWKWVALQQLVIFTIFQAFHTVVWVLQVRRCVQWKLVLQCNRTWAAEDSAAYRLSAASWEFTKAVNYQVFFLPSRGSPDTLHRASPDLLKHGL